MRKTTYAVIATAIASIAVALLVGAVTVGASAEAAETTTARARDVVILQCARKQDGFAVSVYEASTAAPAQRSKSCAETLSLLLRDGFVMQPIAQSDQTDVLIHALVR